MLFLAASEWDSRNAGRYDLQRTPTCRNCVHRKRYALNEKSQKIIQYCELQRSKRSNSGFKTIKVTDKACNMYKENTNK